MFSIFCDIFYFPNPNFSSFKDTLLGWAEYGSPKSMEKLCYTLVAIMICWEIYRERTRKKLNEKYGKHEAHMKKILIYRVRYWVIRYHRCILTKEHIRALLLGLYTN